MSSSLFESDLVGIDLGKVESWVMVEDKKAGTTCLRVYFPSGRYVSIWGSEDIERFKKMFREYLQGRENDCHERL